MNKLPKPFIQIDPNTISYTQGGGCLSVFGVPFLLVGLFTLSIAFGVIQPHGAPMSVLARLFCSLFGVVFSTVGGALVFGRRSVRIDKIKRQIVDERRFLLPVQTVRHSLGDFSEVRLVFDAGDSDSPSTYPVTLKNRQGEGFFKIMEPQSYKSARELAVFMSDFLHLPMDDSATGVEHSLRSPPGKAENFHAEVAHSASVNDDEPLPPRPTNMRAQITDTLSSLTLSVEGGAASLAIVYLSFVPFVFVFFFFRPVFSAQLMNYHKVENVFSLFFATFLIVFFMILPVGKALRRYFRARRATWTASVSREALLIDGVNADGVFHHVIRLRDILAIETKSLNFPSSGDLTNSRVLSALSRMAQQRNGIVIRTQSEILSFPIGLSQEENTYITRLLSLRVKKFLG